MLASVAFLLGILLGAIVLAASRRRYPEGKAPVSHPAFLGWSTFILGLTAVSALVGAMWLTSSGNRYVLLLWNVSIALGFASVMIGITAFVRHDRHWPTWAGFIAALATAVFWLAFAAGNLLGLG